MKKITVLRTFSVLLCGVGGAAFGSLIGYTMIYFFTEDLPFRNASDGERVFHSTDGGFAIVILTLYFLIPGCAIAGFLVSAYFLRKPEVGIITLTGFRE